MSKVRTILCVADPGGSESAVELLRSASEQHDVDAIALVGDLSTGAVAEGYRSVLHALVATGRPAYYVPGPRDAPLDTYLQTAHAVELVHPQLRGVHGTAAFTPDGHLVVGGLGGEVDDSPSATRDETRRLRYSRQEAEYRLKVLDELGEHDRILLFATRPAHRGARSPGSEVVAELINTYRPRLVVTAGERGVETFGKRSLLVAPGSLQEGHYAVADLRTREAQLFETEHARTV